MSSPAKCHLHRRHNLRWAARDVYFPVVRHSYFGVIHPCRRGAAGPI